MLLRNGAIETVGVVPSNRRLKRLIDVNMVSALREAICRYVDVQYTLAAEPPLYLSLALLDAQGYKIGTRGSAIDREGISIDSQVIYGDPVPALKVILDRLWQTAGHAYCPFLN